ncbi:MAG: response regulator transcription factor [Tannerellaceae bacterium]|jgi:DNA-binding NarL/FixJ family response regulator|nr:response regulator transcription factor [Tannerellaceae bacterium]
MKRRDLIDVHIADDHVMVVEMLAQVINNSGRARVTGFSFKLSECRESLAVHCPDILLLDISMTDGDGTVFCLEMHRRYPKMKIIAITGHNEYSSLVSMMNNGASGYIVKSEAVSELFEAIDAVMQGATYISEKMEHVMRKTTTMAITLTPREKQVLHLVSRGMSAVEIAGELGIGHSTVLSFRKKLNLKLSATNPVELITNARKEGLID